MRPSGQIMFALLLRASARDTQGNEAEAEQGEHAGLGGFEDEILQAQLRTHLQGLEAT